MNPTLLSQLRTPRIRELAEAVRLAQAEYQRQKTTMTEVNRRLLAERCYESDPAWSQYGIPVHRITDPEELKYIGPLADYVAARDRRLRELGYDLPPGQCPARLAEARLVAAEHALIRAVGPLLAPDIPTERWIGGLLALGLEKYQRFLALVLALTHEAAPGCATMTVTDL